VSLPVLHDLAAAVQWELREAWASGRRVALSLERCDLDRVEGVVACVAPTGAWVKVQGRLVPIERVLAVHRPSRLGDSKAGRAFDGAGRLKQPRPGQLELTYA